MEKEATVSDIYENQRLFTENEMLKKAIQPFLAVMDAYDAGLLKNARPQWSDVEGDQDRVVLFQDRNGGKLLDLSDFIGARRAFLTCHAKSHAAQKD